MVNGSVVEQVGRNDLLDDLFLDVFAELFGCDIVRVLNGNDDGVYSNWDDGA